MNKTQLKNKNAIVAQLVEHDLAKVGVAGSNPVYRCPAPEINVSGVLLFPEIRLVLVGKRMPFRMSLEPVDECPLQCHLNQWTNANVQEDSH